MSIVSYPRQLFYTWAPSARLPADHWAWVSRLIRDDFDASRDIHRFMPTSGSVRKFAGRQSRVTLRSVTTATTRHAR